jgi:hypothetical protein
MPSRKLSELDRRGNKKAAFLRLCASEIQGAVFLSQWNHSIDIFRSLNSFLWRHDALLRLPHPQFSRALDHVRPEQLHMAALVAYGHHKKVVAVLRRLRMYQRSCQPHTLASGRIPF